MDFDKDCVKENSYRHDGLGWNQSTMAQEDPEPCPDVNAKCVKENSYRYDPSIGSHPEGRWKQTTAQTLSQDPCVQGDLECMKIGRGHINGLNNPNVPT